jgi:hypothetical protein
VESKQAFKLDERGDGGNRIMKHIFISHAGADSEIADKLFKDLKNVGHDVQIDLHELKLGDDTIEFMDKAIANAHTVVIVFSKDTPVAKWQKLEIHAAVWNETAQSGGKVIVLKFGKVDLPPLLGPKMYGSLDDDQYKKTLQKLCTDITADKSETSLVCEALKEGSANPFWRVRAEYFEEMPALLAEAFSPPESAKVRILEEMKPCFLEGSRGTGKTMLLLAMRARTLATRTDSAKSLSELFGFYVRLDRGAFCNAGAHSASGDLRIDVDQTTLIQLTDIFAQEFYLGLLESLISEVSSCVKSGKLTLESTVETQLVKAILNTMFDSADAAVVHLEDLLDYCANMHRQLSEFVRKKFIYKDKASVPFTCFDLDVFKRVVSLVRKQLPGLTKSQITLLLDEYENLFPYQKLVVNSLIKLGPPSFSVKVARKVGTDEVSATTVGQELQETHDYNRIPLIYSVEDDADFARYLQLLDNMVAKLLSSIGLTDTDLPSLLPTGGEEEVAEDKILEEVQKLHRVTPEEFDTWDDKKKATKITYYREAAIYRQLYGKSGRRTKKRFSGHRELAFISSGVIRYFQEILGMAYYLQTSESRSPSTSIDPVHQSEAVHTVSTHNLATLSRNVETYGEQLKYFLLDLGDCLRQKLLHHSSEPEAARLAIRDPEVLSMDKYSLLNILLNLGVKEGVFQTVDGRPGIRPKHVEDPQPVEVNITRIYAPALQLSPRLRWTSPVSCSELMGLLDEHERRTAKRKLITRFTQKKNGENKEGPRLLFTEAQE